MSGTFAIAAAKVNADPEFQEKGKKVTGGYPLQAGKAVDRHGMPVTLPRIITELGVFDVTADGLALVELADGVSREEAVEKTGVPLLVGVKAR